jgi:hypothetical protein
MLLVAFLLQGTWALAGTTGGLSGLVTDQSGAPVAGATIRVVSASQSATTKTDNSGHFTFLSLAPDTYTVSGQKDGYTPASLAGANVFADQQFAISLKLEKGLREIAKVTARAAGNLVKPGTTSDVYSVNVATQTAVQGMGGGRNLDSAYSAIYSQPGVTSQIGNYGFGQVFYIRGSSYSQVGYEYDGVPVNRAFDNYNSNSLTSLGSQETQVYTGGSPASGGSSTLGGYINQVIKTGTYPGYGAGTLGGGYPAFYHKLAIEAGGASPDRNFSYYLGLSGINQDYRYANNKNFDNYALDGSTNGLSSSSFNAGATLLSNFYNNGPWSTCGAKGAAPATGATFQGVPTCNYYFPNAGGAFLGQPAVTFDRENVMNFHFGIPHKGDSGRDDVQAMFYNFSYTSSYGDSIADQGGMGNINNAFNGWNQLGASFFGLPQLTGQYADYCQYQEILNALAGYPSCATSGNSVIPHADGYIFAPGTSFGQDASTVQVNPYYAPGTTKNRDLNSGIDPTNRDAVMNNGSIAKIQYQKNIGSNAFARLLGYSFYSDWLQTSPNYSHQIIGAPVGGSYASPDYELSTHSRGVQLDVEDQINAKNLVRFNANYTTATADRFNNKFYATPNGVTNLVGADGQCYKQTNGKLASCFSSSTQGTYAAPINPSWTSNDACANLPGTAACAAGAKFVVTVPGGYGPHNQVVPKFSTISLEDEFRPTDRWNLNLGVRYENYTYDFQNTTSPDYAFWFAQARASYCYDPATNQPLMQTLPPNYPPSAAGPVAAPNLLAGEDPALCYNSNGTPRVNAAGQQYRHPLNYTNVGLNSVSHQLFSPRVSGTYTVNSDTVLRFSAGRFTQPTQTAFEQYANASALGAAKSDFTSFYSLGFNTPVHNNPVQTSNNYDFSLEKHVRGTDMSVKLSPFYRYTTNQLVTVSLGGNFASGINAGTQKTTGVELALLKGDATRNGFSGGLSYTYTKAKMRFNTLANGSNTIDTLNSYIKAYNQLASDAPFYCAGTTGGVNGTNTAAQQASACAAGTAIANPYYGMAQQNLLDRNGWYDVYANNPPYTAPDSVSSTAISPNAFAGWLNFKRDKFTVSLPVQLNQGTSYGSPLSVIGLDPRNCSSNQGNAAGAATAVGAQYANLPDYQSCGPSQMTPSGYLSIPNPTTGTFDTLGKYREPWQLNAGLQLGYDVTPRVHASMTVANLVNRCFGGTKTSWSAAYAPNQYVCGYAPNGYNYIGSQPGAGFFYGANGNDPANGTAGYPNWMNQAYAPVNGGLPIQAYFQLQMKL